MLEQVWDSWILMLQNILYNCVLCGNSWGKNHMQLWCSGQVKSPHNFGHVFYLYILLFKSLSTYNLIFKLWVTWPAWRYLVKLIQLTDYFWSPAGEEPQKSHCWGPFSARSSPSHRPAHNTISSLITHTDRRSSRTASSSCLHFTLHNITSLKPSLPNTQSAHTRVTSEMREKALPYQISREAVTASAIQTEANLWRKMCENREEISSMNTSENI